MPMVDIMVAGRRHSVQCDEGQEARLKRLAAYLDSKASDLAKRQPQLSEARVTLLSALLLADELFDAYDEIQILKSRITQEAQAGEEEAARAVARVAERLEQLAAALERA